MIIRHEYEIELKKIAIALKQRKIIIALFAKKKWKYEIAEKELYWMNVEKNISLVYGDFNVVHAKVYT